MCKDRADRGESNCWQSHGRNRKSDSTQKNCCQKLYSLAMRRWVAVTVALALAAALSSGSRPFFAALSGAFAPSDFASNVAAARELAAGRQPYRPDFASLHAAVLGIPAAEGRPYFPHPPLAAMAIRPLASLSFHSAAAVWFAVSLGLLFVLAVLLAESVSRTSPTVPFRMAAIFYAALLLWPPVLYNLEKGQWSILLAVVIALVWRASARQRWGVAGALAGAAAALKVFPALLALYLMTRSRWAVAWFAIVAAAGVALPLAAMGFAAFLPFLQHSAANLPYWETWIGVTYSLHGAAARVLIGGPWARPIVHAPLVARFLTLGASLTLVGVALAAAGRVDSSERLEVGPERLDITPDDQDGREDQEAATFAAFVILLVLLNPLSMGHNGVLLALAITLTGRALVGDARAWTRGAWAAGAALVSIPKETIFRLCPIPVDPARSLMVVALPCWGAVLLFVAASGVSLKRGAIGHGGATIIWSRPEKPSARSQPPSR